MSLTKLVLQYLNSKFLDYKITPKENKSEAPIYNTTINNKEQELYITSINLDTERSIKIPKQELGELKDDLWIVLVLIIENEPRGLYIITHLFYCFLKEIVNASHF